MELRRGSHIFFLLIFSKTHRIETAHFFYLLHVAPLAKNHLHARMHVAHVVALVVVALVVALFLILQNVILSGRLPKEKLKKEINNEMVKCVSTLVRNFKKYSFLLSSIFYLTSCTVVCFETHSYIDSIGNERLQIGKDYIEYSVYEKHDTYYVKVPVVLVPETGHLFSVQEKYAPFPDFGLGWRDVPRHVFKKGEPAGYAFVRVIPDYWKNTSFYQKFSKNTQEAPNLIFADNFEEDLPILNISDYDDDVRWCIRNNARYCFMGQNKKTPIHYSLYPLQAAFYVVDFSLTLIVNPGVWILYDLPAAICE